MSGREGKGAEGRRLWEIEGVQSEAITLGSSANLKESWNRTGSVSVHWLTERSRLDNGGRRCRER